MVRRFVVAALLIAISAFTVLGDTLKLKDGTSLEGKVYEQGDSYYLKDSAGDAHTIAKSDVDSWIKTTPASPASPTPLSGSSSKSRTASATIAATKLKAENSETAIAAVGIWQSFIDNKPSAADLSAANVELKHWQTVLNTDGEKVNGKWVWGEEHAKLVKKVSTLIAEGTVAVNTNQTLVGIAKFEEATKLYPNNFRANFELGYFNLVKGVDGGRNNAKIDAGIKSLEIAQHIRPDSAATLSNLSIAYNFREKYLLSVQTSYKAVQIQDSKDTVQNLISCIAEAPPGMQTNAKVKPIIQEALLLASKYSISPNHHEWIWVRPSEDEKPRVHSSKDDDDDKEGEPGIFGDGTGFFISSNGYILTNKHVAKSGDYLMVRMADNSMRLAERVVLDDEQDMAIIKIKPVLPVPFVKLAAYDFPGPGADVAVFGFPLLGLNDEFRLNSSVKMTRGIVTAVDKDNSLCDITVDAIVNPGNSGGPMVDRHGNLLALTAMKTIAFDGSVTTYGLGYSNQRVRKFLQKQKAKLADANLNDARDEGPALTNEDLASRLTPETVCIFMCRGKPPTSGNVSLTTEKKP